MALYLAEEERADGTYAVIIEADDQEEAEAICEKCGYRYCGQVGVVLQKDGKDEAEEICAALNEAEEATKH